MEMEIPMNLIFEIVKTLESKVLSTFSTISIFIFFLLTLNIEKGLLDMLFTMCVYWIMLALVILPNIMSQNPPVDALFSKYLESLKLKESIKSGMAKEMISKIGNPSNLLIHYDLMFISLFMENKVVIGNLHKKTIIPFVEGQYCKKSSTGLAICGILDGPWGMVIKNDIFYVTSFGSDQVLAFSVSSGEFSYAFGDSETLDCPEGIAIDNNRIFVVNYGSSNVAIFDLNHQFIRYLVTRTQVPYLRGPESILLDPEHNHIAITSYANNSLVILNYDGQLQRVVRDIDFPPEVVFAGPIGLALSFKGTYVVTCYKVC